MMKSTYLKCLAFVLKKIAKLTIAKYRPSVVGITGNVGKTSTRTAVTEILKTAHRVRTASKNFNNELGLPATVIGDFKDTDGFSFWWRVIGRGLWQLAVKNNDYPETLVLEYGIDRPGDMTYLVDTVQPDVGIVTAIGDTPVHVEFFDGPQGLVKEKAKLVAQLPSTGFAILPADDPNFEFLREQTRGHVVTYGFAKGADIMVSNFSSIVDAEGGDGWVSFKINYGGSTIPVKIEGVVGKSAAYAAAAAAAAGLISGIPLLNIAGALKSYRNPIGRERLIRGIKNTLIIDDSYNASPKATEEALMTLGDLKAKRKIAVLGDMLELGHYTMEAHQKIGKIAPKTADVLITLGVRAKFIAEEAMKSGMPSRHILQFENVNEAAEKLRESIKKGDLILVKGSQAVRMEKITKEIMAEPLHAEELLVRQSPAWLAKPGLYD